MAETFLQLKWSTSRARDTYGYTICTLVDESTGKRYRCSGGGYDMVGTSMGEWLADVFQDRLVAIAGRAHARYVLDVPGGLWSRETREPMAYHGAPDGYFYGMTEEDAPSTIPEDAARGFRVISVRLDGGCGQNAMEMIANAIGVKIKWMGAKSGRTIGYVATWVES